MNRSTTAKWTLLAAGLLALIILTGPAFGQTVFHLRAEATTITMPDGAQIPMWGFGLDGGPVVVPGPTLTVPYDATTVTILLTNNLPGSATVSIMIPGQAMPTDGVSTTPQVVRNPNGRIRAFTHETAPGTTGTYVWKSLNAGTYLYQSGSHPNVQVPMGLSGALKKDAAPGEAYAGKAYQSELVLLYSEVDPALNAAVTNGTYGSTSYPSTIKYLAKYFLINGKPFAGTPAPAATVNAGQRLLLRLLNAGLEQHTPTLLGLYANIIAEDGHPYAREKEQYSIMLPAGKTMDVIVTPSAVGTYALYDRSLSLTNGPAPNGGMLTYLAVQSVP